MSPPNAMAVQVARLTQELAAIAQRQDNMIRQGPVTHVDPAKGRLRMLIGRNPDGTDHIGPWVPYSQQAGGLKLHVVPVVGQNMTMISPGGNIEQAVAMPFTWNDGNPSPSSSADEVKMTFGSITLTLTASGVTVSVGGFSFDVTSAGLEYHNGRIGHDGKNIGKTHRHGGVREGGSETDTPS